MKDLIFKGAAVAMVTPFKDNNEIDYEELNRLIDFNIENGTNAIVITGTTGESSTLSDEEHKKAIKHTVEYVNKRIPVIAGTGSNNTRAAVELSKYAESVGADGILVVTPYYNKTTQAGLIEHYKTIAEAVTVPIIMYSVPSRTGVNINPETCLELSKIKNIVAIKEASGNLSQVAKIASLCRDNLDIYSGNDDQIVPILSLGGKGVISVLSNVMPRYTHDMTQKFFDGKIREATQMQLDAIDLIDALFSEVNPIPVKYALNLMGYNYGKPRLPLVELSAKNQERMRCAMKNHNLI